jgi:threonine/homoserine/homoserine lactone efflux protein
LSYRDWSLGALTGVLLYVSNPAFIVFWLSVAGALASWISATAAITNRVAFSLGVVVGTALWFGMLLYVVRSTSVRISPTALRRLSLISSIALISFGSYAVIKHFIGI